MNDQATPVFSFADRHFEIDAETVASFEIPSGIKDEDRLFDALAKILDLPDYFGNNWNALYDCLCDFDWIRQHRIRIKHSDLPLEHDIVSCKLYLKVLSDAILDWREQVDPNFCTHSLEVIFPESLKHTVNAISGR
jgi:RNAse (barnase) inhibitor barstar